LKLFAFDFRVSCRPITSKYVSFPFYYLRTGMYVQSHCSLYACPAVMSSTILGLLLQYSQVYSQNFCDKHIAEMKFDKHVMYVLCQCIIYLMHAALSSDKAFCSGANWLQRILRRSHQMCFM